MKKSLRKIIAAICMGTMLLSCTAYGADSSQNLMAYTDNVLSDGSLIYYFEEVAVTLPDFTYIGFSDQSVMNYFMIFPTDFQAYTDDSAIAAEFQQMNTEIDFVKQHAYMLSEGDNNIVSAAEPAKIPTTEPEATPTTEPAAIPTTAPVAVPNTEEYTGSWVQIMDEFEICLLPDWEEVELDEEDKTEGACYAAKCVDQDAVLIVMAMDLTEGYTQEEIEAELAEGNFDSMLEVAEEALKQQGYTIEKTEVIHDIPCTFFS